MESLTGKLQKLIAYLEGLGSAAVAFSGGVDSSFMLRTAHDVLGEKAVAFTFDTVFSPKKEKAEAEEFCKRYGIRLETVSFDILSEERIAANPADRCYLCKKKMFGLLIKRASESGFEYVLDGSNVDDEGDYRPGLKALAELGVKSPLRYAGFTKSDIRTLSKEMGLPSWDKPSLACLASRFAYGEKITEEKLKAVENSEELIKGYGIKQVRVRVHGDIARIEVEKSDIGMFKGSDISELVCKYLKGSGFSYVTLDLEGYRTGSMNVNLNDKKSAT